MKPGSEARKERLAAALRENLRRRKSSVRTASNKAEAAARDPAGTEGASSSGGRLHRAKNRP